MPRRVVSVVQARMSSGRLPGKVLAPLGGTSMLEHVLNAISAARTVDDVIVATSTNPSDDVLAATVERLGRRVHRGPLDDVLARFVGALEGDDADVVVRHTADDPLLDPDVIDAVVGSFLASDDVYASNMIERSWPRGLDTEVIAREALVRCDVEADDPRHREHVTLFARLHPERFPQHNVTAPASQTWPELRLCVDTDADRAMLDALFAALHGDRPIGVGAAIAWLREHPEVAALNADVQQRAVFGKAF